MKEYQRKYPQFSLCGLNCGLCPRYRTEGSSRCPGCGGKNFHLQHPACAVITCNIKHDNVEFCFQCSSYPCERYSRPSDIDSFITYRNVLSDFEKVRRDGIDQYMSVLNDKNKILESLIKNYNDGRSKNFYCIAVNLLELDALKGIMREIEEEISGKNISLKEKLGQIKVLLEKEAAKAGIGLKLRK